MSTNATTANPDAATLMQWDRDYVMGTYARQPVQFVRGRGARLWDSDGKEYLDLLAGIAVCGVGHSHPKVAAAIAEQASTLLHVSNLFHTPLQPQLAKRLCELSGMEKAFFAESGAESNECALKIARKHAKLRGEEERIEFVTFNGSFHGRTLGTITATAQEKYQAPFRPLVPGFRYVDVGDEAAVDGAVTDKTCAVMIEPIQGESGIKEVPHGFLRLLRKLCDERGALLIFDEVQCGMGRTGSFMAYQRAGVLPDVTTLAKSIAAGVPMGACLARGSAAMTLVPGDHASTFGGQLIACAAALAVLDVMEEEGLMANAARVGGHLLAGLRAIGEEMPGTDKEVRGEGLMVGLELANPVARALHKGLMDRGIVTNAIGETVIRFVPPLVISEQDVDEALAAIRAILPTL